jgi:hypothetical protein
MALRQHAPRGILSLAGEPHIAFCKDAPACRSPPPAAAAAARR